MHPVWSFWLLLDKRSMMGPIATCELNHGIRNFQSIVCVRTEVDPFYFVEMLYLHIHAKLIQFPIGTLSQRR